MKASKLFLVIILLSFINLFINQCKNEEKNVTGNDNQQNAKQFTITPESQTITYDQMEIEIPDSALFSSAEIKIEKLSNIPENTEFDKDIAGSIYQISHDSLSLYRPVTIKLDYDKKYQPDQLHIARYDGKSWQTLKTRYDKTEDKLIAKSPGLSIFSAIFGSSPEIKNLQANPPEFSGVKIGYQFENDLVFTCELEDEDNETAFLGIELTITSTVSNAMRDMVKQGLLWTMNPLDDIQSTLVDDYAATLLYKMENVSGKIYQFTLLKDVLNDMNIYSAGIEEIKATVYAFDADNNKIATSDVIEVHFYSDIRPIIKLIAPVNNSNTTVNPIFNWDWNYYTYLYKKFQLVVDESDKPFDAWLKAWTWDGGNGGKIPDKTGVKIPDSDALKKGKKYYWGIRISKDDKWGNSDDVYSTIESFTTSLSSLILKPKSGDKWQLGEKYLDVEWIKEPFGKYVKIELYKGNTHVFEISEKSENTGRFLGSELPPNLIVGDDYRVKIISFDNENVYEYSEPFSVVDATTIQITVPNSSTVWTAGQQDVKIKWNSSKYGGYINIYLYKGSTKLYTIASYATNNGQYSKYDVPEDIVEGNDYRVKIEAASNTLTSDFSSYFTIKGTGIIEVTEPNSNTVWKTYESNVPILWKTGGINSDVKIELFKASNKVKDLCTRCSNSGSYTLATVPGDLYNGNDYRVKITALSNASQFDYSDYFQITSDQKFSVTYPNAFTKWKTGQQNVKIEWTTGNLGGNVKIELFKNTTRVDVITNSTPNDGEYNIYDVPESLTPGNDYFVRITALSYANKYADSYKFTIEAGNTPPVADFTITPASGDLNTDFSFDPSSSYDNEDATSALQVRWDWENDGRWDTGFFTMQTITHRYTTEGTKTVKLEVKDTGGLTDTKTKTVTVSSSNTPPTASFTVSPSGGDTNTDFQFNASASSDNEDSFSQLRFSWDWEDDGYWDVENSTNYTPTHKYSAEGLYTVRLRVTDSDGAYDETTQTITVTKYNTAPTAAFTVSPSSGDTNTDFQFNASASSDNEDSFSQLRFSWDWEDDGNWDIENSTNYSPTHKYSAEGTYTVRLRVTDSDGAYDETTQTITVTKYNTAPTAAFTVSPNCGDTNTDFQFDASASSDNEDSFSQLRFSWDWEDDGYWDIENSTNYMPIHQYSEAGTYNVRLRVKDSGELYDETTFTIIVWETGTMTDQDGNVYKTVKIGNQWWMAENLKVTHYRNGDPISNVTDNTEWANLTTGAYCAYNNDNNNVATYGLLYNWYAVADSRNIAPEGWHVPTDDEWKELEMYLGMSQNDADRTGWRGTDEGNKLKATSGWYNNGNGTNESGFTALPGGCRSCLSGTFNSIGSSGYWWSSTAYYSPTAWPRGLGCNHSGVSRSSSYKRDGFSVRLVRDY